LNAGTPGKAAWMRTLLGQQNLVIGSDDDYVIHFGKRTVSPR
jgi:hypothetical protein